MKRYTATETVEPGLYFNARQFSFKSVDETGPLPGPAGEVFRRVPTALLLVVGPVVGLAFVVFLPFIGFATVGWLLGVKAARLAGGTLGAARRALRPGWEPSLAFFSRTKATKPEAPATDEWARTAREKLDRSNRNGS